MKFFRSRGVVVTFVSLMILGMVMVYIPLLLQPVPIAPSTPTDERTAQGTDTTPETPDISTPVPAEEPKAATPPPAPVVAPATTTPATGKSLEELQKILGN